MHTYFKALLILVSLFPNFGCVLQHLGPWSSINGDVDTMSITNIDAPSEVKVGTPIRVTLTGRIRDGCWEFAEVKSSINHSSRKVVFHAFKRRLPVCTDEAIVMPIECIVTINEPGIYNLLAIGSDVTYELRVDAD